MWIFTSPNVNAVRAPTILESEWGIFGETKLNYFLPLTSGFLKKTKKNLKSVMRKDITPKMLEEESRETVICWRSTDTAAITS